MKTKKKPGKYLSLYIAWMEKGRLPSNGLCHYFQDDELFNLIDPEKGSMETYWAYDDDDHVQDTDWSEMNRWFSFNPLRQTIVLLMAAMNNEL